MIVKRAARRSVRSCQRRSRFRPNFQKTIGVCGLLFSLLLTSFWVTGLAVPSRAVPSDSNLYLADLYLAEATESIEDLQQQQKTIDQQRSGVQQEQERLQTQEKSAQEQLGGLQTRIQATAAQISENEKKLQTANDRLKDLQKSWLLPKPITRTNSLQWWHAYAIGSGRRAIKGGRCCCRVRT